MCVYPFNKDIWSVTLFNLLLDVDSQSHVISDGARDDLMKHPVLNSLSDSSSHFTELLGRHIEENV